jgi:hypothetical protein
MQVKGEYSLSYLNLLKKKLLVTQDINSPEQKLETAPSGAS